MRRKANIVEFRDVASLFTIPRDRGADAERPSTSLLELLDRVLDAALIITAALVVVLAVAMACAICL